MSFAPNEFQIFQPPTDLISHVEFHPTNNELLLASSWDGCCYIYDIKDKTDSLKTKFNLDNPLLSSCFQGSNHIAFGCLAGSLGHIDLNNNSEICLGYHDDAINCLEYCPTLGIFLTGSWDTYVKYWDPRLANKNNSLPQNSRVYAMSLCNTKVIVGTSDRKVNVWDLRMQRIEQSRDSVLKYQTRQIKTFPDHRGFVLSSIEGRVAVEYLDSSPEVQKNKYAFKCHRIKDEVNCVERVYPVNAIAFHKQYGTFATGGSDGYVYIWDAYNKKRLCSFHRYDNQITSLAFSNNDKYLAISSSHLHDFRDINESSSCTVPDDEAAFSDKKDKIYIREICDKEIKPK